MAALADHNSKNIPGFFFVVALIATLFFVASMHTVQRPFIWQPGSQAMLATDAKVFRAWPDGKVDINRATEAELCVLPGVGPALARNIVLDRETNGPYDKIENLDRVPRIGLKTIEWFRRYVVIRDGNETTMDH